MIHQIVVVLLQLPLVLQTRVCGGQHMQNNVFLHAIEGFTEASK